MKITYKSVTGEKAEIETDESFGTLIIDLRKKEHANNERHRYHKLFSIDDTKTDFASGDDPLGYIISKEESEELYTAICKLTKTQRRRILKLATGMKTSEIAASEGISFNSAKESIDGALKKLKKLLSAF